MFPGCFGLHADGPAQLCTDSAGVGYDRHSFPGVRANDIVAETRDTATELLQRLASRALVLGLPEEEVDVLDRLDGGAGNLVFREARISLLLKAELGTQDVRRLDGPRERARVEEVNGLVGPECRCQRGNLTPAQRA